jgi:YidC/Oxa1 family membrane protein insertase
MERRVFTAIVLSFLVLFFYQTYFAPPPPTSPKTATGTAAKPSAPGSAATTNASAVASGSAPATAPAAEPPPAAKALVSEESDRTIVVDTTTVQAVFTNRGGRLLHWRLKDYRDSAGRPVDLVPSDLPQVEQLPFSLRIDDGATTVRLNNSVYRVSGDQDGNVDATRGNPTLAFEFQDAAGLHVRKQFDFAPSGYIVRFSASVMNGGRTINPSVVWGPALGDVTPSASAPGFFNRSAQPPPEAILYRAGKVERIAINTLPNQPVQEAVFRFVGVDTHYFMMAAVNPGQVRADYRSLVVPAPGNARRQLVSSSFKFAGGANNERYFIGPKQFDVLTAIDNEMVRAIYFGTFGFLAVPLLQALKWVHGMIGNWGWAIVVLTVLINIIVFPLRHKSVVSMRKMQALQPQLKAIQDRYASLKVTDPARQKMNTEIMNLYREKGVNPASGCIPMLLQMPVLFAFYAMLGYAIELRGAPFFGWIHDLSQPDPFFVIPILVSLTMFWQQKMMPTTADPQQQQVMQFMPIMFGFIFLTTAAGTALYWFVSNVWTIGQQYFTNRMIGPPIVATARPAAERRLKNAGTGRTAGAEKNS